MARVAGFAPRVAVRPGTARAEVVNRDRVPLTKEMKDRDEDAERSPRGHASFSSHPAVLTHLDLERFEQRVVGLRTSGSQPHSWRRS
jgi:hypothetical protein